MWPAQDSQSKPSSGELLSSESIRYVIHQNKNHPTLQTYYYKKILNQFFLSLVLNESDHETPAKPYHTKLKM